MFSVGLLWVYAALVWQVQGKAAQGGRSTKEGAGGGRGGSKVRRRKEGRSEADRG